VADESDSDTYTSPVLGKIDPSRGKLSSRLDLIIGRWQPLHLHGCARGRDNPLLVLGQLLVLPYRHQYDLRLAMSASKHSITVGYLADDIGEALTQLTHRQYPRYGHNSSVAQMCTHFDATICPLGRAGRVVSS
jgi:hypothetical protein